MLALRGDPPDGPRRRWTPTEGGLTYASELVELARARGDFRVGVAAFPEGHPSAESLEPTPRCWSRSTQAGAEFAITEMFFRAADYFGLVERARARGRRHPDPARHHADPEPRARCARMAELSGREMPDEVVARIARTPTTRPRCAPRASRSPPSCARTLLDGGAPGLHFYTLNRSKATLEIFEALRITV